MSLAIRPRWVAGLVLSALVAGCNGAEPTPDSAEDTEQVGHVDQSISISAATGSRPLLVVARRKNASTPLVGDAAFFRQRVFGATGQSVNQYIRANSGNRFDMWEAGLYVVTDPQNDAAFEQRAQTSLADKALDKSRLRALQLAEDAGLDFSRFDANRDGVVSKTELMVLSIDNYSIDSGQTGWPPCTTHSRVSVCPGVSLAGHKSEIVNFAHELAHQLGAQDAYGPGCLSDDATLMSCTRDGGVMTDPFYYLDPWHRGKLGWMQSTTTIGSSNGTATLFPASHLPNGGSRIVLPRPNSTEKLIFEARKADGYDANVPVEGLTVWYAKEDANGKLSLTPNVAEPWLNDPTLFELAPTYCYGDPNAPDSRGLSVPYAGGKYRFHWLDGVDTGWLITVNPTVDDTTTISWQNTATFPTCADVTPEDFHIYKNEFSGQCMEVDTTNGREVDRAFVRQMPCGNGLAWQQWQVIGGRVLRNVGTGKCLDVDPGTDVTMQNVCDYHDARQRWEIRADGTIKNGQTGKCLDLDARGGLTTPGSYVKTSTCSTNDTQGWQELEPPPFVVPNLTIPVFPGLGSL